LRGIPYQTCIRPDMYMPCAWSVSWKAFSACVELSTGAGNSSPQGHFRFSGSGTEAQRGWDLLSSVGFRSATVISSSRRLGHCLSLPRRGAGCWSYHAIFIQPRLLILIQRFGFYPTICRPLPRCIPEPEVVAADNVLVFMPEGLHHLVNCFLVILPEKWRVLWCPEQLIVQCASVIPSSVLHIDLLWEVWEKTRVPRERQDHLLAACKDGDLALSSAGLFGNVYPYPSFVVLANVADAQIQQLCAA